MLGQEDRKVKGDLERFKELIEDLTCGVGATRYMAWRARRSVPRADDLVRELFEFRFGALDHFG